MREALASPYTGPDAVAAVSATSMREGMVLYDQHDEEVWACPNADSRADWSERIVHTCAARATEDAFFSDVRAKRATGSPGSRCNLSFLGHSPAKENTLSRPEGTVPRIGARGRPALVNGSKR